MKEVKKHLEEAFRLASSIPVKGDAVDVMAVVRNNLRTVYRLLDEKNEPEKEESKEVSADA